MGDAAGHAATALGSISLSLYESERASKLRRQRFFNYTSLRPPVCPPIPLEAPSSPSAPSTRELLSWLWSGV